MAIAKIKDLESKGDNGSLIFLVVEEPEANLHPSLQSLLADLFKDVYKETKGRVRFIIETHSEYLIRRTQVIVAEMNNSEEKQKKANPFKVYYFPEKGAPYDMSYKSNGHFEESFGPGFYGEISKLSVELTRNNRR